VPAIEISLEDLVFDPNVQNYCNHPDFKCPNYGHSWACPPEAPYLEETISKFRKFYLIFYKFNLKEYVQQKKEKNPKRSEEQIRNSFYRINVIRNYLEKEIYDFLDNLRENVKEKLILWDGYCQICEKEGEICTFDESKPCRYPLKKRFSMEAVGINVDRTVKKLKIPIEWPPLNHVYRFALVCMK
jgi:predicted metal-binding protein